MWFQTLQTTAPIYSHCQQPYYIECHQFLESSPFGDLIFLCSFKWNVFICSEADTQKVLGSSLEKCGFGFVREDGKHLLDLGRDFHGCPGRQERKWGEKQGGGSAVRTSRCHLDLQLLVNLSVVTLTFILQPQYENKTKQKKPPFFSK